MSARTDAGTRPDADGMRDPDTGFVVPDRRLPRDRYTLQARRLPEDEGHGHRVTVLDHGPDPDPTGSPRVVGTYTRNYRGLVDSTFEPFRQFRNGAWRDYALLSARYTHLAVMDLTDGRIIAEEQPTPGQLAAAEALIAGHPDRYGGQDPAQFARTWGFCPAMIRVPDWWEAHDGSIHPGHRFWGERQTRPTGEFGLYAGCHWGDDGSWKLRHVDLSRIAEGVLGTDSRFGYVEIPARLDLAEAVSYSAYTGRVDVAVAVSFDLATGAARAETREDLTWADAPSLD